MKYEQLIALIEQILNLIEKNFPVVAFLVISGIFSLYLLTKRGR